MHGGRRLVNENGFLIYSADESKVLPMFEYLHVLLLYLHHGVNCVPRGLSLRSLLYLEYFLSVIYMNEFTFSSAPGLQRLVLKQIDEKISGMSTAEITKHLNFKKKPARKKKLILIS